MCRILSSNQEFFLVHPGGPYFAKKNEGSWTIPKGLVEKDEALLDAAMREFQEETGLTPTPPFKSLDSIKMKSGKIVHAWSFTGSWTETQPITSNKVEIEWPPHSGRRLEIPEIDRAEWMSFEKAALMIIPSLLPFLERARSN